MNQIQFMDRKILYKKVESSVLDKRIQSVNLDVAELNLKRNIENEEMSEKERKNRYNVLYAYHTIHTLYLLLLD